MTDSKKTMTALEACEALRQGMSLVMNAYAEPSALNKYEPKPSDQKAEMFTSEEQKKIDKTKHGTTPDDKESKTVGGPDMEKLVTVKKGKDAHVGVDPKKEVALKKAQTNVVGANRGSYSSGGLVSKLRALTQKATPGSVGMNKAGGMPTAPAASKPPTMAKPPSAAKPPMAATAPKAPSMGQGFQKSERMAKAYEQVMQKMLPVAEAHQRSNMLSSFQHAPNDVKMGARSSVPPSASADLPMTGNSTPAGRVSMSGAKPMGAASSVMGLTGKNPATRPGELAEHMGGQNRVNMSRAQSVPHAPDRMGMTGNGAAPVRGAVRSALDPRSTAAKTDMSLPEASDDMQIERFGKAEDLQKADGQVSPEANQHLKDYHQHMSKYIASKNAQGHAMGAKDKQGQAKHNILSNLHMKNAEQSLQHASSAGIDHSALMNMHAEKHNDYLGSGQFGKAKAAGQMAAGGPPPLPKKGPADWTGKAPPSMGAAKAGMPTTPPPLPSKAPAAGGPPPLPSKAPAAGGPPPLPSKAPAAGGPPPLPKKAAAPSVPQQSKLTPQTFGTQAPAKAPSGGVGAINPSASGGMPGRSNISKSEDTKMAPKGMDPRVPKGGVTGGHDFGPETHQGGRPASFAKDEEEMGMDGGGDMQMAEPMKKGGKSNLGDMRPDRRGDIKAKMATKEMSSAKGPVVKPDVRLEALDKAGEMATKPDVEAAKPPDVARLKAAHGNSLMAAGPNGVPPTANMPPARTPQMTPPQRPLVPVAPRKVTPVPMNGVQHPMGTPKPANTSSVTAPVIKKADPAGLPPAISKGNFGVQKSTPDLSKAVKEVAQSMAMNKAEEEELEKSVLSSLKGMWQKEKMSKADPMATPGAVPQVKPTINKDKVKPNIMIIKQCDDYFKRGM